MREIADTEEILVELTIAELWLLDDALAYGLRAEPLHGKVAQRLAQALES